MKFYARQNQNFLIKIYDPEEAAVMCAELEKWGLEERHEGRQEGRREGRMESQVEFALGVSLEKIAHVGGSIGISGLIGYTWYVGTVGGF